MKFPVARSLPVAVALLAILLPGGAMANRPKIKPHHKVPKDWRKFVAAKNAGVRYTRSSSDVLSVIDISALYKSGSTTSYAAGSVSMGASFGNATFYSDPAAYAVAGMRKIGDGVLDLTSVVAFTGNTNVTRGAGGVRLTTTTHASVGNLVVTGNVTQHALSSSVVSGRLLTVSSSSTGSNFVLGDGTTLVLAGGSRSLPSALVAAINGGQLTLANADGTVSVEVDPVTNEQSFMINGQPIPWPDASNPLRLVKASNPVMASAASLTAPAANFALGEGSALSGTAPVPEPSTALLVLLGAGFLAQRRRRG